MRTRIAFCCAHDTPHSEFATNKLGGRLNRVWRESAAPPAKHMRRFSSGSQLERRLVAPQYPRQLLTYLCAVCLSECVPFTDALCAQRRHLRHTMCAVAPLGQTSGNNASRHVYASSLASAAMAAIGQNRSRSQKAMIFRSGRAFARCRRPVLAFGKVVPLLWNASIALRGSGDSL